MAASPRITVIELQTVGSTNDHAKALAKQGYPEGTIVWAHEQTGGKGRQGNSWQSDKGNLFMTMILRPSLNAALIGQLSFLAAVALADTIKDLCPADSEVSLKWPNDLLLNRKKAAGILLETEANGVRPVAWVVVGIGVNITSAPPDAACLVREGIQGITSRALLDKLGERIISLYEQWRHDGFDAIRASWMGYAANIGKEINVRLPNETMHGIFHGIDNTGALELGLEGGGRRVIASGEVYL